MSTVNTFPSFWFNSNQWSGEISSEFELYMMIGLTRNAICMTYAEAVNYVLNSLQNNSFGNSFGRHAQYKHGITLREWLKNNNFDIDEYVSKYWEITA